MPTRPTGTDASKRRHSSVLSVRRPRGGRAARSVIAPLFGNGTRAVRAEGPTIRGISASWSTPMSDEPSRDVPGGVDAFSSAPDGIVVVDGAGTITAVNAQLGEMFGY